VLEGGVSLIHPFYKDEKRIALQLEVWKSWSPAVCKAVDITIVDDGSPNGFPLTDEMKGVFKDKGIKFSLYKINIDLKWNTPGALNLGVMVSPKQWILYMDTDCFFPSEEWEKILELNHPTNRIGKFPRIRYGDPKTEAERLKNTRYLPCTMLMHKNLFMSTGGFDEDFTGARSKGYGFFDTDFSERAIKRGIFHWKTRVGILYDLSTSRDLPVITAGEWMPSICGDPTPGRAEAPDAHKTNKHLWLDKWHDRIPQNKQILNFPWEQVYSNWFST
jgi:hypothetical protein